MPTSRSVLAHARAYAQEHPSRSEQELRRALQDRFLGDINYSQAVVGAALQAPDGGTGASLLGCLLGLLLSPFFALRDRLFKPTPERINGWIEASIKIVRTAPTDRPRD